MSKREIPAAIARAGITGMTHNLPEGFAVNFAKDFVRIFKEDIQRAGQTENGQSIPLTPSGSR